MTTVAKLQLENAELTLQIIQLQGNLLSFQYQAQEIKVAEAKKLVEIEGKKRSLDTAYDDKDAS